MHNVLESVSDVIILKILWKVVQRMAKTEGDQLVGYDVVQVGDDDTLE